MKKYSLHLLTVIFLATGIASCKKETAIPEDNTAEVLRNAQSALSQDKSDYYLKNCPAKNVVFILISDHLFAIEQLNNESS
jgi:hypothetical protein